MLNIGDPVHILTLLIASSFVATTARQTIQPPTLLILLKNVRLLFEYLHILYYTVSYYKLIKFFLTNLKIFYQYQKDLHMQLENEYRITIRDVLVFTTILYTICPCKNASIFTQNNIDVMKILMFLVQSNIYASTNSLCCLLCPILKSIVTYTVFRIYIDKSATSQSVSPCFEMCGWTYSTVFLQSFSIFAYLNMRVENILCFSLNIPLLYIVQFSILNFHLVYQFCNLSILDIIDEGSPNIIRFIKLITSRKNGN